MSEASDDDIERLSRRALLSMSALFAAGAISADWLGATAAVANGAWGGYGNGQIPLSALDVIEYPGVQPWHYSSAALSKVYMAPGASDRLMLLLKAYHDDVGGYLRVAEGYRTLEGQQWLHDNDNGGPVGQSNHGWGQAVDFDSGLLTAAQANWLAANGDTFFFFPLAGDYGHYDYTGPITPPDPVVTANLGEEMTDIVYFADSNLGPRTLTLGSVTPPVWVEQLSFWYQECIGAPLFFLGAGTSSLAWTMEYTALKQVRGNNSDATRLNTSAAKIAQLIDLRGQATLPKAGVAPLRTP